MTAEARVVGEQLLVLGIGEKGDVAGPGILDAGDAYDVDVTVAFEAAFKA